MPEPQQRLVDVICPGWGPHTDAIIIGQTTADDTSHGMCRECRDYMESQISKLPVGRKTEDS